MLLLEPDSGRIRIRNMKLLSSTVGHGTVHDSVKLSSKQLVYKLGRYHGDFPPVASLQVIQVVNLLLDYGNVGLSK